MDKEGLPPDLYDGNDRSRGILERSVITPDTLMTHIGNLAARLDEWGMRLLYLRAIVKCKNDKEYGGYRYVSLVDPLALETVTIQAKVRRELYHEIEFEREYVFSGCVVFQTRADQGTIAPLFKIQALESGPTMTRTDRRELETAATRYTTRPKRDVDAVLRLLPEPCLAIITGSGSKGLSDVEGMLGEYRQCLKLMPVPVSLRDAMAVATVVRDGCGGAHVLAIVRGGGDRLDLEVLDNLDIFDAVAKSPVPVVAAVGHCLDQLVLDRVVDRSFGTPSELGVYLKQVCEQKILAKKEQEAAVSVEGKLRDQREIGSLRVQTRELQQTLVFWRRVAWGLGIGISLLVVGHLVG